MEQQQEDLGPPDVWQIRAFPRGLRQYLADEARKEGIVVGDLLTRIVLAYRSGSLGKVAPAPAQNGFANVSNGGTEAALDRAIDRACKLAQHSATMPKGLAALAYGLVKAEMQALKPPSTKVLKPRLTHEPAPEVTSTDVLKPGLTDQPPEAEPVADANPSPEDRRETPLAAE